MGRLYSIRRRCISHLIVIVVHYSRNENTFEFTISNLSPPEIPLNVSSSWDEHAIGKVYNFDFIKKKVFQLRNM